MEQFDSTLRNASVTIAGGACIVPVLARIFNPYGWLPVRGVWLASMPAIPLLCLWCGMLLHYRAGGKARVWLQAAAGLVAAYMFYLSRRTVHAPGMGEVASTYLFAFFLGVVLPWDHLRENGDRPGAKSAVLCALTALTYAALFVVWQRLIIGPVMVTEYDDMRQFLLILATNMLPLAVVPPILFAVEFAFSKAGQWLGSRKWFLWLAVPAAIVCYLWAWERGPFRIAPVLSWETTCLVRLLVQPVTVYLLVVSCRAVRMFKGIDREYMIKKDIFKI